MNRSSKSWSKGNLSINVAYHRGALQSPLRKWLIKILGSITPGLTWYIRSFPPVATMSSLLQKNLLNTLSAWCCCMGMWCLMFVHSGFPFLSSWGRGPLNLQVSQVPGLLLGSFHRYLLGLLYYKIRIEFFLFLSFLHFPHYFFTSHPSSLSCSMGKLVFCSLVKI